MEPGPPAPKTFKSAKAPTPTFGAVFSHSVIEAVIHPAHDDELRFETWNRGNAKISNSVVYGGREFIPEESAPEQGASYVFPRRAKPSVHRQG